MFHSGGWLPLSSATWRRLYCVLASFNNGSQDGAANADGLPQLLGFAAPRDCAEGRAPERVWSLDTVSVRPLSGHGASAKALELARGVPAGFEIEDYETGTCWHFACDSLRQQSWWLEAIGECSSQRIMEDLSGACSGQGREVKPQELHPLNVCDISDNPGCKVVAGIEAKAEGDAEPATDNFGGESQTTHSDICASDLIVADKPPDALSQLRRLESQLAGAINHWKQTLETTEADCSNLLCFFGLETSEYRGCSMGSSSAASGAAVGTTTKQLLNALSDFVGQVREAWLDLEKHSKSAEKGEAGKNKRRSTPTSPAAYRKGGLVQAASAELASSVS